MTFWFLALPHQSPTCVLLGNFDKRDEMRRGTRGEGGVDAWY